MLIQSGEITGGQLVSFLLYLSSLSDAFNMMGSIFSSLTQAVGAADKVFELMHRKPKVKTWSGGGEGAEEGLTKLRGKVRRGGGGQTLHSLTHDGTGIF